MIEVAVPFAKTYAIENLLLDLNGTLAVDGAVLPGVKQRLQSLSSEVAITLLTCDTHGNASTIANALGIAVHVVNREREAEAKAAFAASIGPERTAAIGNGMSDMLMLHSCAIGVVVIGSEGAAVPAILAADIVTTDILDALDLFRHKVRLVATLRGRPHA
jgi:soluble P-type ATPase